VVDVYVLIANFLGRVGDSIARATKKTGFKNSVFVFDLRFQRNCDKIKKYKYLAQLVSNLIQNQVNKG